MLKVRIRARVGERRASPLARRPSKTRIKHRSESHTTTTNHGLLAFECLEMIFVTKNITLFFNILA